MNILVPSPGSEPRTDLFIAGQWREGASGKRFAVYNPATEAVFARVADASIADGAAALDAAEDASVQWAATAPRRRAEILRRAFELMMERAEPLARMIVEENGKALADARSEIAYAAEFFRWYSEEAVRVFGDIGLAPGGRNSIVVDHQPVGIALLITPWNFPAAMATRKIAPALAAGCTCILKPAEATPLTALAIAAILEEAGVPAGAVNVVTTTSSAAVVGAMLKDPRLRKLSFTGSTAVGRTLLRQAADQVIDCSMELGGNAPFIVFEDADIDAAVADAMIAKMRNGGEACTAANRFYVQRGVADEFTGKLTERMAALQVGNGLDDGVELGPLIDRRACERIDALVREAVEGGARLLTGGRIIPGKGHFFEPTVLCDVPAGARLLREEIFGPVAPVMAFDDEDEVVAKANDTEYGLVAYVHTRDIGRGLRVARRIETGMVGLNRGLVSDPAAPFGGCKQSGIGREGGQHGIMAFLEPRYVAVTL